MDQPHTAPVLSRHTLSTQVAAFIRQEIVSGRLHPGDRLVEADLAQRLQTSKSPVREALRLLEAEGLVVSHPHRGACVAQLDAHDLWELDTIRALLEPFAAQQAVAKIDADGVRRLEDIVTAMGSAADPVSLSELHAQFHTTVMAYSQHSRIVKIMDGLWSQLTSWLTLTDFGHLGRDQVQRDHRVLLEALKTRDPAQVRSAFDDHVVRTLPGLMEAVPQDRRARDG